MNTPEYHGIEARKVFQVVVVGTKKAGKSSVLQWFSKAGGGIGGFPTEYDTEPITDNISTSGGTCRCEFSDNYFEDYEYLTRAQLDKILEADVVLCVTDCSEDSVRRGTAILETIQKESPRLCFLVANKSDEYDVDMITQSTLNGYAQQAGAYGVMVSAQTGLNMDHLEFMIADMCMNPNQTYGRIDTTKQVGRVKPNAVKKKCAAQ